MADITVNGNVKGRGSGQSEGPNGFPRGATKTASARRMPASCAGWCGRRRPYRGCACCSSSATSWSMGIPNLKPSLFAWEYNSENVSLMPALINTVLMTAFRWSSPHRWASLRPSGWWSTPARQPAGAGGPHDHRDAAGHPLHRIRPVRHAVLRHAAAVGLQPDRRCLHPGHHGAAGHHAHHRGSAARRAGFLPRRQLGLGAGKLRTVFTIVLPSAMPGILSGVILARAASWARPLP